MNKSMKMFTFVVLATFLIMPLVSTQWISELEINKNEFTLNERLTIDATVENPTDLELLLQSLIFHSNMEGLILSNSIEIDLVETKTISLHDFAIDDTYNNGDYSVLVRLVDVQRPDLVLDSRNLSFLIRGVPQDFSFNAYTCKDQSCAEKSKVFLQGENVYFDYSSEVENVEITATLTYPDKKIQQLILPTSIKAEQIGTYEVEVIASKEGYKTVTDSTQFGVIKSEADIKETTNKIFYGKKLEFRDRDFFKKTENLIYFLIGVVIFFILIFLIVHLFLRRKKKRSIIQNNL